MSDIASAEKSAVNGIRTALGVGGVIALIIGVLVLVHPFWQRDLQAIAAAG